MAKVKLAGERLGVEGSGRGTLAAPRVSGSASTASASRGVSAPRINVNAGNQTFTPVRAPDIKLDNTLSNAAEMSSVWLNAATEYANRENKVRANDAVLFVNDKLRDRHYGGTDSEGNAFKGYDATNGIGATDSYEDHVASIDKDIQAELDKYGPEVRQHAMLRIAEMRNSYRNKASTHRAQQLEVHKDNQKMKGVQSLLRDAELDPNSLFAVDPVTHQTKIDNFIALNSETEQEAQVLRQNLTTGVFDQIRFNRDFDKRQAYSEAGSWYSTHKESMDPLSRTLVESKLETMQTSAEAEQKKEEGEIAAKQTSAFIAEGGRGLTNIIQQGEVGYPGLEGYVDVAMAIDPDDPNKGASMVIQHLKQSLYIVGKTEDSYAASLEAFGKISAYAAENNIDILNSDRVQKEIGMFLDTTLQSALKKDADGTQKAVDAQAIVGIAIQNQEVRQKMDKSGTIYETESEFLEEFPQYEVTLGDSKVVANEKRQHVANNMKYSKDIHTADLNTTDYNKVMNTLKSLKSDDKMFESEAEFEKYLLANNITKEADQSVMKAERKRLNSREGQASTNYHKNVTQQIIKVFRPEKNVRIGDMIAGGEEYNPFADTKNATAAEMNLRNRVDNVMNDLTLTPVARVEKTELVLKDYISSQGAKDLTEALNIEAVGVRTDYYTTAQELISTMSDNTQLDLDGSAEVPAYVPETPTPTEIMTDINVDTSLPTFMNTEPDTAPGHPREAITLGGMHGPVTNADVMRVITNGIN